MASRVPGIFALFFFVHPLALVANAGEAANATSAKSKSSDNSAAKTDEGKRPKLSPQVQAIAERLERTLPTGSEARAMYDVILQGGELGPGEGWFQKGASQSRYDWNRVAKTYDANHDAKVQRSEFPGSDADFARIDRNGDRALTEADFNLAENSRARTPGSLLFREADRDGDGKITREEFEQLFDRLDEGGRGYLAWDDLRDRFRPELEARDGKQPDEPSVETLIQAFARQELGSLQPGPALEEPAPDFTLSPASGGASVTLSRQIGPKPVVLIFGNFTCGPFRSQAGSLEKLYLRYRDRATFLVVYVREAHPSDGWWMESNRRIGINPAQPQSDAQRCQIAGRCRSHLKLPIPFLVDTIDDRVGTQYSGMPDRLYLIDREGRIAFKSGRGPFGFKPRELEQSLILLLAEKTARPRS